MTEPPAAGTSAGADTPGTAGTRDRTSLFVVVSGPPGSGKSTLAGDLSRRLGLPLVAKDEVKEALMVVLGVPDVEASRRLGRAAVTVMLRLAGSCPRGAVLEANFHRSLASTELARLEGRVVEVFCACPRSLCRERYRARAAGRAAGHFDAERPDEELWNDEVSRPVDGGWPVLEVRTEGPVDVASLVSAVRALQQA